MVVWLAAAGLAAMAQTQAGPGTDSTATAPPSTTVDALYSMADAAGVIFAGTVTGIRRSQLRDGSAGGVVEVDFAVTEAIRGVSGGVYTLREWAGLWAANDQPLQVGRRYLMMLHQPNSAGLSSPVAGGDGAIPVRGAGPAAVPDSISAAGSASAGGSQAAAASVTASGSGRDDGTVVDLGWVATHVAVAVRYAAHRGPTGGPISVHARAHDGASPGEGESGQAAENAAGTSTWRYSAVVSDLRAREAAHAARR